MPKVLSRALFLSLSGPAHADRIGSRGIPVVGKDVLFPPLALRGFVVDAKSTYVER